MRAVPTVFRPLYPRDVKDSPGSVAHGDADQPITVLVDRASVAMGDDVDSHLQVWEFPATATTDDLLAALVSRFLLPMGGWTVYADIDDEKWRRVIAVVYPAQGLICHSAEGWQPLTKLSRKRPVSIYAVYHGGSGPATLAELRVTGSSPTLVRSEAYEYSLINWHLAEDNRRQAEAARSERWSWIRAHLLNSATPRLESQWFIANNFHFLTDLLCNASLSLAAELLGLGDDIRIDRVGDEFVRATGGPEAALLAMVIGAFEWGVSREESWQRPLQSDANRVYLEFLTHCGYVLSPIELLIAGNEAPEVLTAHQARVRQLRNSEYHLRRNHKIGLMDHRIYLQALEPVAAELHQLGEEPKPPEACCDLPARSSGT